MSSFMLTNLERKPQRIKLDPSNLTLSQKQAPKYSKYYPPKKSTKQQPKILASFQSKFTKHAKKQENMT